MVEPSKPWPRSLSHSSSPDSSSTPLTYSALPYNNGHRCEHLYVGARRERVCELCKYFFYCDKCFDEHFHTDHGHECRCDEHLVLREKIALDVVNGIKERNKRMKENETGTTDIDEFF